MPKHCHKFKLTLEEDGVHYLSGVDGSLFHPQEEKFYTNEEYCVDYFYDKAKEDPVKVFSRCWICVAKWQVKQEYSAGRDVCLL